MRALPGGTITFLFTDVEGSTRLLRELGDRYGDVLADHRRILRETLRAAGGEEVDTQGDAFFFSFPRARDAVAGAVAAQRALAEHEWPGGVQLKVRMGLHTGEPAVGEEGYLGLDVVRAARICAAGEGGQILLSATTRALAGSSLPDGVAVRDLGELELKDLDPEHVFELVVDGGGSAVPAVAEHPVQAALRAKLEQRQERRSGAEALGESWERRFDRTVEDFVHRQLEHAFSAREGTATRGATAALSGLVLVAAVSLVVLAAAVVVIVLLVKLAF